VRGAGHEQSPCPMGRALQLAGVRRGSPDPAVYPTAGLPPGSWLGTFGRRNGKVRRPCHNLVRDRENSRRLFPASSMAGLFSPLPNRGRVLVSSSRAFSSSRPNRVDLAITPLPEGSSDSLSLWALVSTQLPVPLKLRCIKGLGLPGGRLPPVLLCITTEGPRCEGPRRQRKPREVGKVLEDREGDGLTLTSDSGPVRHFFRKSNHPWSCERPPLHRSRATTPSRLVRILSRFREFLCRRWNLASRGAS